MFATMAHLRVVGIPVSRRTNLWAGGSHINLCDYWLLQLRHLHPASPEQTLMLVNMTILCWTRAGLPVPGVDSGCTNATR